MERMSRWFVRRWRSVVVCVGAKLRMGREELGCVVGEEGAKWSGVSAMEVQFWMARNSVTSTGKFLG
jgi:hypothetical protein